MTNYDAISRRGREKTWFLDKNELKLFCGKAEMSNMSRGRRGQLMGGVILVTLGALLLLHRLLILNFYTTSWPLLLVAIGLGFFMLNRRTWAGWIVGGIGVILFVVNFVIVFFPGVLYGWLRARTGTIAIPTLYHAASNLLMEVMLESLH